MIRLLAATMALAALLLVVIAGPGSMALAHSGDHAHMSVVELVMHLSASLDHKSAIGAIAVAFACAAAVAALAGRKRPR